MACAVFLPLTTLADRQTGPPHPPFRGVQPRPPWRAYADLQETSAGNRIVRRRMAGKLRDGNFQAASNAFCVKTMQLVVRAQVALAGSWICFSAIIISFLCLRPRQNQANLMTTGMFITFVYALFKFLTEPVKRNWRRYSYQQCPDRRRAPPRKSFPTSTR